MQEILKSARSTLLQLQIDVDHNVTTKKVILAIELFEQIIDMYGEEVMSDKELQMARNKFYKRLVEAKQKERRENLIG